MYGCALNYVHCLWMPEEGIVSLGTGVKVVNLTRVLGIKSRSGRVSCAPNCLAISLSHGLFIYLSIYSFIFGCLNPTNQIHSPLASASQEVGI